MAWTAPHTYTVSELVTASTLNTDIRDNQSFLHSPPAAIVYNDANISIANNMVVDLTFNSEYIDNASIHDTGSNTGRLTAPIDGVYLATLSIEWAAGSNNRYIGINYQASTGLAIQEEKGLSSAVHRMSVSTHVQLDAGEWIGAEVYQNHGSALNVQYTGEYSPRFGMVWTGEGT